MTDLASAAASAAMAYYRADERYCNLLTRRLTHGDVTKDQIEIASQAAREASKLKYKTWLTFHKTCLR